MALTKTIKTLIFGSLVVAGTYFAWAVDAKMAQTVLLKAGWNVFSLDIAPEESADEIFSSWPVDSVAYYDSAAFLETKQYSGTVTTEGSARTGYIMWRRGEGVLSSLKSIPVGVYACFNTNAATAAAFQTTLAGVPAAPRITWHPSSTNDSMNLIGISLASEKGTTIGQYFDGFDGGNANTIQFFGIQGLSETKISTTLLTAGTAVSNGQVIAATCLKASDWSGAFFVSPRDGIDFMTNATYMTISVRNDSVRARPIKIILESGLTMMLPEGLVYRDMTHYANTWASFSADLPIEKTIEAGETLELMLAVDRTKLGGNVGDVFGGLITVTDETVGDYATNFRATIPLKVTSDGGASSEYAWPKGLWLASGVLDTVTFLETVRDGDIVETLESDVKAGGKMQVRLPLYVEKNGDMKLLQRFVYGSDTNGATHVYSPDKEDNFPVAIGNVKRVSSAVLPIDNPQIDAESGAFGVMAAFPFTVSENSPVNPYRHVYHPSHDGLQWDFENQTPSGDNITNYVSTVKPEIFSVKNRITFTWDGTSGTAWNPDEELEGDLLWELGGVRHEGTIRMKGRFTMKRISSVTLDK